MAIHAVVTGRLSKDAEMKQVGSDQVLKLSVASSFYAGKGKGQPKKDGSPGDYGTTWVGVDVWGKRGESLAGVCKKGATVLVRGEVRSREHDGKLYLDMRADDVQVIAKAEGSGGGGNAGGSGNGGGGSGSGGSGDDDIPF
jgi:single-strand DNA-binding protein